MLISKTVPSLQMRVWRFTEVGQLPRVTQPGDSSKPRARPVAAIAECVWGFKFANYCFPIDSLLIIDAEAENTPV